MHKGVTCLNRLRGDIKGVIFTCGNAILAKEGAKPNVLIRVSRHPDNLRKSSLNTNYSLALWRHQFLKCWVWPRLRLEKPPYLRGKN